jgi:hypothetical protein
MEYKTKFDLSKNLFFLHKGKIIEGKPDSIRIEICAKSTEDYWFKVSRSQTPSDYEYVIKKYEEVFESRENLIESL